MRVGRAKPQPARSAPLPGAAPTRQEQCSPGTLLWRSVWQQAAALVLTDRRLRARRTGILPCSLQAPATQR